MSHQQQKYCLGACGVAGLVSLIIFGVCMGSYHHLGPDDQVLIKSASGNSVVNGPGAVQLNPFKSKEWRKAVPLGPLAYAAVQDTLTAVVRHEQGSKLLFLGAYDTLRQVRPKLVLEKDEYLRLVDRTTGEERVEIGPRTIVPSPVDLMPDGTLKAVFLDHGRAAVVLNKQTGMRRLVTLCTHSSGVLYPAPQEEIVEVRPVIHVLPHEAMVVRDVEGTTTVYSGAEPSSGQGCQSAGPAEQGTSFFLPPYSKIVRMYWSDYSSSAEVQQGQGPTLVTPRRQLAALDRLNSSMYTDAVGSASSSGPKVPVVKVDLRAQKAFYSYEVRTSDNVKLLLDGTIFWQVSDVRKMINMTADPEGDVWARSRSTLISAVSNATLSEFMNGFNDIVTNAFTAHAADSFYALRGITMWSMELTRYTCVDEYTRQVLQQIIRETTNRINRLQKQRSDNEVRSEKLTADIQLEQNKTSLIETKALNTKLLAETRGATDGGEVATGISSFIDGLGESLPNITERMSLYRFQETLKAAQTDARQLSGGNASLYIAPKEMDLRLQMPHAAQEL